MRIVNVVEVIRIKFNDNFKTPDWLLQLLFPDNKYFDPCPLNPKPIIDGLTLKWTTDMPIFINPPWSNPRPWIEKAIKHKGHVTLLLPLMMEAGWWSYRDFFDVIIIWDRIKFLGILNNEPKLSRCACMIWRK